MGNLVNKNVDICCANYNQLASDKKQELNIVNSESVRLAVDDTILDSNYRLVSEIRMLQKKQIINGPTLANIQKFSVLTPSTIPRTLTVLFANGELWDTDGTLSTKLYPDPILNYIETANYLAVLTMTGQVYVTINSESYARKQEPVHFFGIKRGFTKYITNNIRQISCVDDFILMLDHDGKMHKCKCYYPHINANDPYTIDPLNLIHIKSIVSNSNFSLLLSRDNILYKYSHDTDQLDTIVDIPYVRKIYKYYHNFLLLLDNGDMHLFEDIGKANIFMKGAIITSICGSYINDYWSLETHKYSSPRFKNRIFAFLCVCKKHKLVIPPQITRYIVQKFILNTFDWYTFAK